jgi:nucleoside-diphosphate-sugar epimerase
VLNGQKILITGASGLVGMELARGLARNNEVWGLARYLDPSERGGSINAWAARRQDVQDLGVLTFAGDLLGDLGSLPTDFTHLIHLAHTRLNGDRLPEAIEVNAIGAGRIMHHCRTARAALIMSSTAAYTPPRSVGHLLAEDDPLGGASPPFHNVTSPASKISLEAVSRFCAREFGLPTVIMRANVVYGVRGGFPTRDLHRIASGQTITKFGDPYPHSPIHFDDMIDQIEALMDAASTRATILNWCGDEVVSQRDWCEQAAAMSGWPLHVQSAAGAPGNACDPTRRRSVTGPCRKIFADAFRDIYRTRSKGEANVRRQIGIAAQAGDTGSPG